MRRMLQAADALRLAGAIDEARMLLRHAKTLGNDAALRVTIDYAHYRLQVYAGGMIDGRDGLIRTGAAAASIDPAQAGRILGDAALASMVIGDLLTARTTGEHALQLAERSDGDPPLAVTAANAMVNALTGDPVAARSLLHPRAAEIDALDPMGI